MGCFSSPSASPSDSVLQNQQASIAQEQFQDYTTRYEPILTGLISEASDPDFVSRSVSESVEGVDGQFAQANTDIDMTNRRYRQTLTGRQQKAQDSLLTHDKLTTKDDVSNRTRSAAADLRDGMRLSLIETGQGIRNESLGNLSTAASMESRRAQNNLYAQGQSTASNVGMLGNAAGLATSIFMLSDKNKKTDIKDTDSKKHLENVRSLKIKTYRYKDGIDPDEKKRTGVLWQEAPNLRAPKQNGKVLDLGDWSAANSGAIQALDKEIKSLKRELRLKVA